MSVHESPLVIIVPFLLILGGVVSFLVKKEKLAAFSSALFFLIALSFNTWLLLNVGEGAFIYPNIAGIVVNASSAFITEIALLLAILSVIYSYRYFEDGKILPQFYFMFSIFITTLILMSSSFNILIMYITFEASTITGGVLILFTRRRSATKAAARFFILSGIGAVIILSGILYQNMLTGFVLIREMFSKIPSSELVLLASLYALGFGIKVGIFPFGLFWLPAAHSEAPTPVSAILSGIMVQVAAFVVARIIGVISPASDILSFILVILGTLSIITGSMLALIEAVLGSKFSRFHVGTVNIRGIKRIWAFSTCSEMGVFYILIGLGISSPPLFPLFFMGILLHFLNHGLAKALLFFDSGFIIETSRIADLSIMKGIGRKLGVNGFSYLIGGSSLSMIPGTLGYNTLLEITSGHMTKEVAIIIIVSAILIFTTTVYSLLKVAYGKPKVKIEYLKEIKTHTLLRVPGIVLSICILILGMMVLLGSSGIALQSYYHEMEKWFSLAAKTVVEPWVMNI